MNEPIEQGVGSLKVRGFPDWERWSIPGALINPVVPLEWDVVKPSGVEWDDNPNIRYVRQTPFRRQEKDLGFNPEGEVVGTRGTFRPGIYKNPKFALPPVIQALQNLQSAYIKHVLSPGQFERAVNLIKGAPSAIGNALIDQWAAIGTPPGTAALTPSGETVYSTPPLPPVGRATEALKGVSKALTPRKAEEMITPDGISFPVPPSPPPTTMQMTKKGDEPPPLPSEKLLATTPVKVPEAVASWVVAPGVKGLTRETLIEQVGNNARTVKVLEDKGYKGNTVPLYRLIVSRGQSQPEGLISATLDPKKLSKNIGFFLEGKLDLLGLEGTGDPQTVSLARYDVPKEHLKLYVPDTINKMDNPAINKALAFVKERRAEGFEDIENPAEHARFLAEKQDEIIADVSGIDPKIYPISPLSINFRSMDREILEGNIRSPEDFGDSRTVLDFRQFKGSEDEANVAETAARRKKIKDVLNFFNLSPIDEANRDRTGASAVPARTARALTAEEWLNRLGQERGVHPPLPSEKLLATTPVKAPTKPLYHATFSKNIENIKKKGFRLFRPTTLVPRGQERQPGTFAFTDPTQALRWANLLNREYGEPVSVFKLKGGERWVPDPHPDPLFGPQASFYTPTVVPPEDILGVLDVGSFDKEGLGGVLLSLSEPDFGLTGQEDPAKVTRALDLLQKLKNIEGEAPPLVDHTESANIGELGFILRGGKTLETIGIPGSSSEKWGSAVPRHMYHSRRGSQPFSGGIAASPIAKEGEREILQDYKDGHPEDKVVWLGPERWGSLEETYLIDLSKLDVSQLRATGQAEGNVVYRGDIPASAIEPLAPTPVETKSKSPTLEQFTKTIYAGTRGAPQQQIAPYGEALPGGGGGDNRFGGIFGSADREVALSHGDTLQEFTPVNMIGDADFRKSVLYDDGYYAAKNHVRDIYQQHKGQSLRDDEADELLYYISGDKDVYDSPQQFGEITGIDVNDPDALAEASWDLQGIKGEVARRMGYDAVGMADEHGESMLVLSSPLPIDESSATEPLASTPVKAPEEQLGLFEEAAQIKPQQLTAGSLFDEKKGRRLLIVGCCKTKSKVEGRIPASERYKGTLFATLNAAGVPKDVDVAVLSAKHGLIRFDTPLEDYNVKMKDGRKDLLKSPEQLARINNTVDGYGEVFVAGGEDYRNFLDEAGIEGKYTTYKDLKANVRGIGDQRSILAKWLKREKVEEPKPESKKVEELRPGERVSIKGKAGVFYLDRPLPNGWLRIRDDEQPNPRFIKVRKEDVSSAGYYYAGGGGVNSLAETARNMTRYAGGGGVNSLSGTARSMFV